MDSKKHSGHELVSRLSRPFSALLGLWPSSNRIQSSSSYQRICKYDVFISFRGSDTRNTFTDHLYNHLIGKGIFVFKDDKLLEKGQPISPQLLQAIKDSRVSIVVFSKDYASSTWCLDEMATIADCRKELEQTVFPVFYDVDPSHVRKQSGEYANAFAEHKWRFFRIGKVNRWMRAMTDLASLAGWDVRDKNAFKFDDPSRSCMELIPKVLEYVQGHPLAIKVLGSFLCKRDATQWGDALDGLQDNPNKKIMDVLQVGIMGLEPTQRDIFLHIACFFKGEREDYVKRILDCCGLHPHIGIPVIIEKSLITIRNQEIHMHELLQHLGMKIVRQEFPEEPGLWSRLWLYEDFHHVMMTQTGSNHVKAIVLNQKEDVSKSSQLRVEELSKMRGLRLLILHHKNFSGSLSCLSSSLQYFHWHGYPSTYLPSKFEPDRLVELNMPDSSLQRLDFKHAPCLKRMDLSNSKYLIETPNFEGIPKLERLDLTGCTNLSQVHPSIGGLEKLAFLSLRNCSNVVSLDFGGGLNLSSLRVLNLSGCTKLENTPNFAGLINLECLDLEQCTSLTKVHESIGVLDQLKFLSLRHCTNLVNIPGSVNALRSLTTLDLCGCIELTNLPLNKVNDLWCGLGSLVSLDARYCNLREVPDAIGGLSCLERLNLEGNKFVALPYSIKALSNLAYLNLAYCHELQRGPGTFLVGRRERLTASGRYFKAVSGSRNHRSGLYIFNCSKLIDNELPKKLNDLTSSELLAFVWLRKLVEKPCCFRCGFDIVIPGSVIPGWFSHQFKGNSIIRMVDSNLDDKWSGVAFCVAFEVNNRPATSGSPHGSVSMPLPHPFYLSFESEHAEESFDMPLSLDLHKIDGSNSNHLWLIYISRPHCHFVKSGARITFKACPGLEMKKWGLRRVKQDEMMNCRFYWLQRVDCLRFEYVHESSSSSSWPKIQLPYNWFVTDEEENENLQAKEKENRLSNIGF